MAHAFVRFDRMLGEDVQRVIATYNACVKGVQQQQAVGALQTNAELTCAAKHYHLQAP